MTWPLARGTIRAVEVLVRPIIIDTKSTYQSTDPHSDSINQCYLDEAKRVIEAKENSTTVARKKKKSILRHFPAFRMPRRADSIYVYHYTLAFEPDFCWSNVALQTTHALPDEYQWSFYRVLNSRSFVPKLATWQI